MTGLSHSSESNSFDDTPQGNFLSPSLVHRVYRAIDERIAVGEYGAGQRLPSVRASAAFYGVSRDTVLRAYDKLVARGRAVPVRGSGFYVAQPQRLGDAVVDVGKRDALDAMHLIHSDLPLDHQPGSGVLRHENGAQAELARVVRSVVANGAGIAGGYGDPLGYLPLRQQLRTKMTQGGIDCPIANIVTTPGALAGLTLAVRALLRPGSTALVEDPCSFAHYSALLSHGTEIRHVPRLADGPDLDVLRELCERYRPQLFVLSSLMQNPTGTSIVLHKAQKLLEIAAEFEMVLIDDCSYADLVPCTTTRPAAPLVLFDQLRWVVHVGGFARTVSPTIGPGYILAGETQMRFVRVYRPTGGLGNTAIAERTLYRMLGEGIYRRRCERIQTGLARRSLELRRQLAAIGLTPDIDRGGMFVWTSLGDGIDAATVAARMLACGYLTAPGRHFSPARGLANHMRFNVTTTTEAATRALAACL